MKKTKINFNLKTFLQCKLIKVLINFESKIIQITVY